MALHTEQLLKVWGAEPGALPDKYFSLPLLRSRSVASELPGEAGSRAPRDKSATRRVPEGHAHTIRFLSPRHRIFLKARRKSWLKMV